MNQSLESIKIFFDYNQKPFWKIINAETNGLITENYKVDDMGLSWDRLVIAYNTFVHSGSFKLIVKGISKNYVNFIKKDILLFL